VAVPPRADQPASFLEVTFRLDLGLRGADFEPVARGEAGPADLRGERPTDLWGEAPV